MLPRRSRLPSELPVIRLGLVVNPIAGMGGRVGLHGTDGDMLADAVSLGAEPLAGKRVRRALSRIEATIPELSVLTVEGAMGADLLPERWTAELRSGGSVTNSDDTRTAVAWMTDRGVDLVLFGGGDGTARDVARVVDSRVPILGVPCGVKMHSGVFATGPEAAGAAAARYLLDRGRVRVAEIVDAEARGVRLFGLASVPDVPEALQGVKSIGPATAVSAADMAGLGRAVAAEFRPDRLYLLGPGTTVGQVGAALGLPVSLYGVDAVRDGKLLAADVSECELLALIGRFPQVTLVLGVIGGQGFLFGRGNQQLSPAVLDAIGPENIEIIAAAGKIAALDPPVLRIDLDDRAIGDRLTGFRKIRTSRQRSTVLRVVA